MTDEDMPAGERAAEDRSDEDRSDEQAYLLKRADDHRLLAERSPDEGSRAIHERFERAYRSRACDE